MCKGQGARGEGREEERRTGAQGKKRGEKSMETSRLVADQSLQVWRDRAHLSMQIILKRLAVLCEFNHSVSEGMDVEQIDVRDIPGKGRVHASK